MTEGWIIFDALDDMPIYKVRFNEEENQWKFADTGNCLCTELKVFQNYWDVWAARTKGKPVNPMFQEVRDRGEGEIAYTTDGIPLVT